MGAKAKSYRREGSKYKRAHFSYRQEVGATLPILGKAIRRLARKGADAKSLAELQGVSRRLHELQSSNPDELAAAYTPTEAERFTSPARVIALQELRLTSGEVGATIEELQDRALGTMFGLAIGEMVGDLLSDYPAEARQNLEESLARSQLSLKDGAWAIDTASALALMDSLLAQHGFNADDFIGRLADLRDEGIYACVSERMRLDETMLEALDRYQRTGRPCAGDSEVYQPSDASLARLAPVAIRYWRLPAELAKVAADQSRVTHAASMTLQGCTLFAGILADAIAGLLPAGMADEGKDPASHAGNWVRASDWRALAREKVRPGGGPLAVVQAALWCVGTTNSFEEAVFRAASLSDSGSLTSMTGQLAGALHGACSIPNAWLEQLPWRDRIEEDAAALFKSSVVRRRSRSR